MGCEIIRKKGYENLDMCPTGEASALREDCTCYALTFVEYFQEILYLNAREKQDAHNVILGKIESFVCQEFHHLPEFLEVIITDSVPIPYGTDRKMKKLVQRRVKRQLSLGVPTDDKWEVIIPQLPQDGRHHYSPIGSYVALHCSGTIEESRMGILDSYSGETATYTWTHENGMEITAPYTNIDQKTGDLTFHRVRLEDTSIYNCTRTTQAEYGEEGTVESFLSQLDVIAGPTYWLRFGMTFEVGGCRHKELAALEQKVHFWVHQYVCHFCPIMNVSLTCTNFGGTRIGEDEKYVMLRFSISVLGFEELLTSWSHNHIYCNMECQTRMHAKVLSEISKSLFKLFILRSKWIVNCLFEKSFLLKKHAK